MEDNNGDSAKKIDLENKTYFQDSFSHYNTTELSLKRPENLEDYDKASKREIAEPNKTKRTPEFLEAHQEFVKKVEEYFMERVSENPSYSLRGFAKRISIDQSFLSKVLKGKK